MDNNDFRWNKLNREDYLYFLHARINSHALSFYYNYPSANAAYFCLKPNGDINMVPFRINRRLRQKPLFTCDSIERIITDLVYQLREDIKTESLGEMCYIVKWNNNPSCFFYRIPLEELKEKSKIKKQLENYRTGKKKYDTKANNSFRNDLIILNILNPKVIYKPLSRKKYNLFQDD